MNNKQIIKAFEKRRELFSEKRDLDKQIEKLLSRREKIEEAIDLALQVREVYKGVPLSMYREGNFTNIYLISGRKAQVYRNARNCRYWGIYLFGYNKHPEFKFVGCGWPSRKVAMEIAREWVAFGKKPKQSEINKYWSDPSRNR